MEPAAHARLRRMVRQRLENLERAGVVELLRIGRLNRWVPEETQVAETLSTTEHTPSAKPKPLDLQESTVSHSRPALPRKPPTSGDAPLSDTPRSECPVLTRDQRIDALQQVQKQVAACARCEELARTRTQTVFGVGDPEARLVFLGEAPGADEDRQGEPFVGRAGQLLTKIIEACTLRRDQVYILNVLKCRPPGNRNPAPAEAANCREFLKRQLEIIQPEYICCLGAVATQNLLETTQAIGRLRGRFHDFHGIKVVATYHPAYLLRNPSAKRGTWDDMRMLMRDMGIQLP